MNAVLVAPVERNIEYISYPSHGIKQGIWNERYGK